MKDPVDGEYPFQWSVTRRRIQVMGARGLSVFLGWRLGTMRFRCLHFGANTPWKRVRFEAASTLVPPVVR